MNPEQIARAAATDAGNRSMRAAGRTAWDATDYDVAVLEYNRLKFAQHQADDPHCTCNDCMDVFEGRTIEPAPLRCHMERDCTGAVSYVDNKGYVYCTVHGCVRRSMRPCRKLTPAELDTLRSGGTIAY
jgi:hypothetical protein